eukprot:2300326-Pleurochrysis_carterae.AAC.1
MPRQIAAHCALRSKLSRKAADAPHTPCGTPASSMRTPSLHAACGAHVQDSTRISLETAVYDDDMLVVEIDCDEICGLARYYPCSYKISHSLMDC